MSYIPLMAQPRKRYALLCVCFLLAACGNSNEELTRDIAAEKLTTYFREKGGGDRKFDFNEAGFNRGIELGYWDMNRTLTEKGKAIFEAASGNSFTLKKPIGGTPVEVTGIADAVQPAGAKEIQFTYSNEAAKDSIRFLILGSVSGSAIARRFDDGWRIEDVKVTKLNGDLTLSDADLRVIDAEKTAEANRKAAIYKEATTATTNVAFKCETAFPDRTPIYIGAFVSDTSVEFHEGSEKRNLDVNILFKDLSGVSIEDFYGRKLILHKIGGGYLYKGYENCPDIDEIKTSIQTNLATWKQKWNGVDIEP